MSDLLTLAALLLTLWSLGHCSEPKSLTAKRLRRLCRKQRKPHLN